MRRRSSRGRVLDSDALEGGLDALVEGVQDGQLNGSMRDSPSDGADEESLNELAIEEYPERPVRRRALADLLRAAGFEEAAASAPNVTIADIITCNSPNREKEVRLETRDPVTGEVTSVEFEYDGASNVREDALYVCVPSEDGLADGHDWADEASQLGAVAVISDRPLPDCLLPVVVVDNTLQALGRLAAEFYGKYRCAISHKESLSIILAFHLCAFLTTEQISCADHPSRAMHTVAFIGSYGKTTTAWLTRGLLEEAGEVVAMVGEIENAIMGDKLTLEGDLWDTDLENEDTTRDRSASTPFAVAPYHGKYEFPPGTPDALHLQKVLSGAADRGADSALVEVCPAAAADGRVDALRPEILVFTNTMDDKAAADTEGVDEYNERISAMFEDLEEAQTAVINTDTDFGRMLARQVEETNAGLLTYGVDDKNADVYAEKIKLGIWETEILVRTPVGRLEIIVYMLGRFNVANVLAAVAVGLARGVKLVSINAGIEAVEIIPGHSELIYEEQPFPVIVDGARTPQQISRLIDEVKESGARRTILVVGCPGSSTKEERVAMGSMAHFKADVVFFTNDSPGTAMPDQIIADMVSGMPEEVVGRHAGSYYPWLQDPHRTPQWFEHWLLRYQSEVGRYVIEDRYSAIRVAVGLAKPRDVVVVAGHGHIDYMDYWDGVSPPNRPIESLTEEELEDEEVEVTGTVRGWFDDRVECRNAVSNLSKINDIKDLDRSTLPWTRYPEERDLSGLSASVGEQTAEASGQGLDKYLRNVADEIRDRAGDFDDLEEEEDAEEEEEEEEEGAVF